MGDTLSCNKHILVSDYFPAAEHVVSLLLNKSELPLVTWKGVLNLTR